MIRDPHPSDFISSLTESARANPVAAALIGGGALWLLFGSQWLKDMTGAMMNAARPLGDVEAPYVEPKAASLSERAEAGTEAFAEQSRVAGQSLKDGMSSAVGTVKESIADTVGQAGAAITSVPNPIPSVKKGYAAAQSTLSDLLDRQPLVLGAVGVAIGAAMAGAVPVTNLENEWAGPSSDDIKADVQTRAVAASAKVRSRIGDLASESRGIAEDTVDRFKRAGQDAVAAARQKAGATST
jgi:hypothetical protein